MLRTVAVVALAILWSGAAASAAPSKLVRHPTTGIPGEYIVVLPSSTQTAAVAGLARSIAAAYGLELHNVWEYSLRGFLVKGASENVEALATDPRVKFVEQNFRTRAPKTSATQWTSFNGEYLWHLDRVDELSWADRDSQHNMCTEGREVYAYVIDTGVQRDHEQFESPTRVVTALDFSDDRTDLSVDFTDDATNGCTVWPNNFDYAWHGTAVASVLGGTQVGVAKPQIVSLKVFRCGRLWSQVSDFIDALDWIPSPNNPWRNQPGVINHSGFIAQWAADAADPAGNDFSAYGDAVEGVVAATNMPYFTSADNFSADACQFSPNDRARTNVRAGSVFVVGGTSVGTSSTDSNDYRYQQWVTENGVTLADLGQDSGSNSGECVSIYAPAVSIYAARHAAFIDGDDGQAKLYDREDGTSFASPMVAGIAARHMQRQRASTGVTPGAQDVYTWLLNSAQATVVNPTTPEYWYCAAHTEPEEMYRTNPPANCSSTRWGQDGPGTAPYYFPTVGNTSGARMVYFDEGHCP